MTENQNGIRRMLIFSLYIRLASLAERHNCYLDIAVSVACQVDTLFFINRSAHLGLMICRGQETYRISKVL